MHQGVASNSSVQGKRPLKIGLLVDSSRQFWNVHALVAWAAGRDDLAITHLLIDRGPRNPRVGSLPGGRAGFMDRMSAVAGAALFPVLRAIESLLVRRMFPDVAHFDRRDLGGFTGRAIDLRAASEGAARQERPESSTGTASTAEGLEGASLAAIERLGLDLIVSAGAGKVCAGLIGAARLGVVSVDHGSEFAGCTETAAFWETCSRKDTTGFTIRVHAGPDARAIAVGHVRNRFSFLWNQTVVYKKSLHYLQSLLVEVAARGKLPTVAGTGVKPARPGRMPGPLEQLGYSLRFARAAAERVLAERVLGKAPRWSVYFAPCDWRHLNMQGAVRIENPKGAFLADPFLLEAQGRTFCFVEELSYDDGKGCIAAYELTGSGASRIGRVITEPFHLSFPYVFEHGSAIYMVPESSENRDVRVYECVGLPDQWELRKVLMSDVATADTMLFEHGGRWWMFTNLDPAGTGDFCAELHIFHADDPLSDKWTPHPMNPVLTDARRARNAGILMEGGTLYRVSQRQGFDTYGSDFSVNRIDVLTPEAYAESELSMDRADRFNRPARVHHLHSNGKFSVFDHCKVESIRT